MNKHLHLIKIAGIACLMMLVSIGASAQWELLRAQKAAFSMHVTKSGNMLLSDYLFDRNGGIYLSEDNGETWTKTDIADYNYSDFIEAGDYIIALGYSGYLARSNDEGKTWEQLYYAGALKDILDERALEYTACYGAAYHKGKLFIADFMGGNVLYSEDFGETWNLTDYDPFWYDYDDGGKGGKEGKPTKAVSNIYRLTSFNGELYAFSAYFVHRYVEETNSWELLRNDGNFMNQATIFNGKLFCGHSIMNESYESPFLESTTDGRTWNWVNHPEGVIDCDVRTLASDDKYIYAGGQKSGFFCTANEGETWTAISEGLPARYGGMDASALQTAMKIIPTEDYIYLCMYDQPFSPNDDSGIYRLKRSDLDPEAINSVSTDNGCKVTVDNSAIYVAADGTADITLTDVAGKNVNTVLKSGKADISTLVPGLYIYKVVTANGETSGKFLKK